MRIIRIIAGIAILSLAFVEDPPLSYLGIAPLATDPIGRCLQHTPFGYPTFLKMLFGASWAV
jgi:hypothetical protein